MVSSTKDPYKKMSESILPNWKSCLSNGFTMK